MYNLDCTLPSPRGVNAILRAIETEFGGRASRRGKTLEALVIGGHKLTDQARYDIAEYAFAQNWEIIYVGIENDQIEELTNLEISYFETYGVWDTVIHEGGQIWKTSSRSQPRLVFPSAHEIKANPNGSMEIRETDFAHHPDGFEFALQALRKRVMKSDPGMPVTSWFDDTRVIYDIGTQPRAYVPED